MVWNAGVEAAPKGCLNNSPIGETALKLPLYRKNKILKRRYITSIVIIN